MAAAPSSWWRRAECHWVRRARKVSLWLIPSRARQTREAAKEAAILVDRPRGNGLSAPAGRGSLISKWDGGRAFHRKERAPQQSSGGRTAASPSEETTVLVLVKERLLSYSRWREHHLSALVEDRSLPILLDVKVRTVTCCCAKGVPK